MKPLSPTHPEGSHMFSNPQYFSLTIQASMLASPSLHEMLFRFVPNIILRASCYGMSCCHDDDATFLSKELPRGLSRLARTFENRSSGLVTRMYQSAPKSAGLIQSVEVGYFICYTPTSPLRELVRLVVLTAVSVPLGIQSRLGESPVEVGKVSQAAVLPGRS